MGLLQLCKEGMCRYFFKNVKKREKERERKLESIFSSRNTESYPHEYIFTDVKKRENFITRNRTRIFRVRAAYTDHQTTKIFIFAFKTLIFKYDLVPLTDLREREKVRRKSRRPQNKYYSVYWTIHYVKH